MQAESIDRSASDVGSLAGFMRCQLRQFWDSDLAQLAVLFLVTAVLYLRTGLFGFVNCDDGQYVYENPWVKGGLSLAGTRWAFSALHAGISYWHPLTWLSHQLDCQIFDINPGAHHLTSVWLHAANVLLVFALVRRLGASLKAPFFIAGVFAIHPLHVESVAWIAERKDVLYSFLWLTAFNSYLRFRGGQGRPWYGLALGSYVASLMSKPTAVTLPVVLILYELFLGTSPNKIELSGRRSKFISSVLRPFCWCVFKRVYPFAILAVVSGILTVVAQIKVGAVQSLANLPFSDRAANALVSYVKYLRNTLCPFNLSIAYIDTEPHTMTAVIGAALLLILISAVCLRVKSTSPWQPFGWFWFLFTLVPNIGLVQAGAQSMADRYMYIPLLGILLMLACFIQRFTTHLKAHFLSIFEGALFIYYASLSWNQISYWKNGVTLFERAVTQNPANWIARLGLGMAMAERKEWDGAMQNIRFALELPGNHAEAHRDLGLCYFWQGQSLSALSEFEEAFQINPRSADICLRIAHILTSNQAPPDCDRVRGVAFAERGLALRAEATVTDLLILAKAYQISGRLELAQTTFNRAAALFKRQGTDEMREFLQVNKLSIPFEPDWTH